MNPKVSINVLSWNQPLDTIECVESCKKIDYDNYEIVILDNNSTDNSMQLFKEHLPDVRIIQNSDNLGYAGGNNVGIRFALEQSADYVLILNNDVVVEPDFLTKLINAMEINPKAGMGAPKVLYYDRRSFINSLGTSMNWMRLRPLLGYCNQIDDDHFSEVLKKDILVGCALLIKKDAIKQIGLLDENFYLIHEEADWCYRSLRSGFENIVVPKAAVYHKVSKTIKKFPELVHYYNIRNFLYLTHRNASKINLIKVYLGLCFLMVKHIFFLCSPKKEKRGQGKAFFFGIYDFFSRKMGKCARNL